MALRVLGQQAAVHVRCPAAHHIAGQDVLGDGRLQETLGGDDPQACGDLLRRGHAQDAAVVVHVAVGVDHRADWPIALLVAQQLQRRRRRLGRGQRIDDNPAGLAFDEGDVGDVEATHLIDAGRHLEQAVMGVEPRLPPEARVHRVGPLALKEGERALAPGAGDLGVLDRADETPLRQHEVGAIVGGQGRRHGRMRRPRRLGGGLPCQVHVAVSPGIVFQRLFRTATTGQRLWIDRQALEIAVQQALGN